MDRGPCHLPVPSLVGHPELGVAGAGQRMAAVDSGWCAPGTTAPPPGRWVSHSMESPGRAGRSPTEAPRPWTGDS